MSAGISQNIYLGNEEHPCDAANPDNCSTCTLQNSCYNPCVAEDCEICFGQTEPLDPSCTEVGCTSGTEEACTDELDCDPNDPDNPNLDPNFTYFCLTGCCTPLPE